MPYDYTLNETLCAVSIHKKRDTELYTLRAKSAYLLLRAKPIN